MLMVVRWLAAAWVGLALLAQASAQTRRTPDTGIEPTSWGKVVGQVYDGHTLLPVPYAAVSVGMQGTFADEGRSTAKTSSSGQYEARAPIGRVSENFDIGRALSSGIAGLLLGGATNRTKRIDVVQLAVRVRLEGYREFRGLVPCRALDAGAFTVRMEPILLAPLTTDSPSFVARGWGLAHLDTVAVAPDVARPGDSIVLRATVRAPRKAVPRDVSVVARCALWGTKGLAYVSGADDGELVYSATVRAPSSRVRRAEPVLFGLTSSRLDIDGRNDGRLAYVQVVGDPDQMDTARARSSAWAAESAGDHVEATARWRVVCQAPGADHRDHAALAESARRIHSEAEAAAALERAVALAPEKERLTLMGRQAAALRWAGDPGEVISRFGTLLKPEDKKDRRQELPPALIVALGESYVATGDLERAADVDARLLASQAPPDDAVRRFRSALRSAQARATMAAHPDDPVARTRYARLLLDEGRWNEAEVLLRPVTAADPSATGAARDLAYAVSRKAGPAPTGPAAYDDQALRAARERLIVYEGGKPTRSKDFRAWHDLAMVLLARATQVALPVWDRSQLEECRDALREALRCARSGANVNEGAYGGPLGYLTARTVGIAGYSYAEAVADAVVYESLGILEGDQGNDLALLALAGALCDLSRPDIAESPARRASALLPDDAEARYVMALAELGAGDRDVAIRLLGEVLAMNPRHPSANLRLAELSSQEGETALAARYLAAHATFYGTGPSSAAGRETAQ